MEEPKEENSNVSATCSVCHQAILPEYYFCPNCGNKVSSPPLLTTSFAQLKLYLHSLILPSICFITIGRWKGIQYMKSNDQKTKTIGMVSGAILIISIITTFWIVVTTTQKIIDDSVKSINQALIGY